MNTTALRHGKSPCAKKKLNKLFNYLDNKIESNGLELQQCTFKLEVRKNFQMVHVHLIVVLKQ